MAGDWIPISVDMPSKPEVARLSAALGKPIDEIVGTIIRFWIWVQTHTADGYLEGLGVAEASAASQVPARFLGELEKVGWLQVTESGLAIPQYDRWFSGAAKRRLRVNRRVTQHRMKRSCNADVTHDALQKALPEREKRRDIKYTPYKSPNGDTRASPQPPPDQPQPDGCSSAGADGAREDGDSRAFAEWWKAYPRKVGKQAAERAYRKARQRICRATGRSPPEARDMLLEAAQAFAVTPRGQGAFCPHPSTWLNQGRWEDDRSEWQRGDSAPRHEPIDPFA